MKIPRWMTPWRKADQNAVTPIGPMLRLPTSHGFIIEAFGGAWQANLLVESNENLLRFSAVYACIALRARDIAKLRVMLMKRHESDGIWDEVTEDSPFLSVLRKPNHFQTRIQFISFWIVTKLMYGNAYILKERDSRGVVRALYPLDPRAVQPLVAQDGEVFYRLNASRLAGLRDNITVPASEIIHDRCITPWHPLVGVSPLFAGGPAATQGIRIQTNSETFFKNMSRPSGHLTAEGQISDETADRLKKEFHSGHSNHNIGKVFVSGDGLKFEPFTMPAEQSQLIEQQNFSVADVARAFGVPLYKIQAGDLPSTDNVGALHQMYLDQTLQEDIQAIEALLDEGLELPGHLRTEIDEDGLMRMDPLARAKVYEARGKAGTLAPNEARRKEGLHPVTGGESPYLQQQNYSLAALSKRDASDDPFGTKKPATPPAANDEEVPDQEGEEAVKVFEEGVSA